jgi:TatD DNase family protein
VWIGFCGNVTYPKAQYIRNSFAATPLDRIVIETDSPYLAPQGLRGTVNTPANIGLIYQYCAELASMNLPDFATRIQQNFCDLYRIPHDSLV